MRAVVLRGGRLGVREVDDPVPGPGELLLRTLSTAICASDVHFMDHPEMGIDDPTGRSLYDADRDIVLGHEFVGEVIGHGPQCSEQFSVGTRVTSIPIRAAHDVPGGSGGVRIIGQHPQAQGSFGELVVVAESLAKPVDAGVSVDAAALTDAFAVGEFYVRSARMEPGEIPLVIGAGAIGLSAVAALAGRGIEPIIVSDYNSERRALACDSFGAHVAVDPAEQSPFDVWRELRVERGLWGPMVVFECVGASGLIQKIVDAVDIGTRIYCAGGWYTGDTLNITDATRQGVTIQFGGGPHPQDWYGTLDPIAAGRLDPLPSVGAVVGLDEVPDALDSARKSTGPARIIVHPNGDVQ
jgi:threonine dehydrogenase-like Zn-dependent dehydrogenase